MISNEDALGEAISGSIEERLEKVVHETFEEQDRLHLLKNLDKNGLATRDIISFISNQADLRRVNKHLDLPIASKAMKSKIKDSQQTLEMKRKIKSHTIKQFLSQTGGKKHKLRRILGGIRRKYERKAQQRCMKNERKIEHLQKQLDELKNRYDSSNDGGGKIYRD